MSLALALVMLIFLISAQQWRLFERGWFVWREGQQSQQGREHSLWLTDYRVVVEAQPLLGLDEVSGLAFDPDRNSLFAVTNTNDALVELSLTGQVLRSIPLQGFGDAEAVEYISPGIYVISDERRQRLYGVQVDEDTRWLDADTSEQLTLELDPNSNKGFEGLAYDAIGRRLFVAKERDPLKIIELSGFPWISPEHAGVIGVSVEAERDRDLFVRDLSGLTYDQATNHLLALSDESRLVLELDVDGEPISSMSLLTGMTGLSSNVLQAEGIALDKQGTLYLVSEPNLFYVFRKPVDTD